MGAKSNMDHALTGQQRAAEEVHATKADIMNSIKFIFIMQHGFKNKDKKWTLCFCFSLLWHCTVSPSKKNKVPRLKLKRKNSNMLIWNVLNGLNKVKKFILGSTPTTLILLVMVAFLKGHHYCCVNLLSGFWRQTVSKI